MSTSSIQARIDDLIISMGSISLVEMDHVKLMRRRDTKFVVPIERLPAILEQMTNNYRVLEIDKQRIHAYQTVYYDTPGYEMYLNHHNGRLNRYKVRIRKYLSSDISFLEIKFKNNRRETIKRRIKPQIPNSLNGENSEQFLSTNSPYSSNDIDAQLENYFQRITLVNNTEAERITIDTGLTFTNIDGTKQLELPNIAIIEVKHDRDAKHSGMIDLLKKNRIQATGFSKYCMGTALMIPGIRTNLFKSRLRKYSKFEYNMLIN